MELRPIHGKNLVAAGYGAGILVVRFAKSGEYFWSGVPEEKFISLCRVPYPDKFFSQAIKGKYPLIEKPQPPKKEEKPMEVFRPEDGMKFIETDPATGQPCHYYELKGQRVPFSLTQILEISGLARVPTEASEIAARPAKAKLGTKVHEYTLWYDQGELDLDDLKPYPAYYNRVIGWQQFREDFKFHPDLTSCEIPIGVRINGMLYAMKLDAYGAIGEGDNLAMAVVEKKCSVSLEASYALQTAGQAIAFKSHAESVQMPLKRYVVQLFDKPNQANRYYFCQEHNNRMDEKVFIGAGLTNVYFRLNNGLLKGNQ